MIFELEADDDSLMWVMGAGRQENSFLDSIECLRAT